MPRRTAARFALFAMLALTMAMGAFSQGTLHRGRPETETRDSSGNLKPGSASNDTATIRGSVVLPDGSSPRQLVSIYCDCGGVQTLVAIADAKGAFSFNRGALDVVAKEKTCKLRPFLEGYRAEPRPIEAADSKNPKRFDKLQLQPLTSNPAGLIAITDEQASKAQRRMYEKGLDEAAKGELANAITLLQKATSAYPEYSSAWFGLGIVQENRGDKAGAEHSFQRAVEADPQFALPLIRLAALEAGKGNWLKSVEHSAKAIEINPAAFPDAYALNAIGNVSLQNMEAAEKSARQGLKLDQDHQYPELEYSLGIVLYAKGETREAGNFLRSYLSQVPNGPNSEAARNELSQINKDVSAVSAPPSAQDKQLSVNETKPDGAGPAFTSLQKENARLIESTPAHTCLETISRVEVDTQGKPHDPDLKRVQIAVSEGKEI